VRIMALSPDIGSWIALALVVALAAALWRASLLSRRLSKASARNKDPGDVALSGASEPVGGGTPVSPGSGIDHMPLPVCVFTPEGRVAGVNEAFMEWHGGARVKGLPENSKAVARLRLLISRLLIDGEGLDGLPGGDGLTVDLEAADGRADRFSARFSALGFESGTRLCVLSPVLDTGNADPLSAFLDEAPFGVVLMEPGGTISAANQEMGRLLDDVGGTLVGRDFATLVRASDRSMLASLIADAVGNGRAEGELALADTDTDGEGRFVSAVLHAVPDPERRVSSGGEAEGIVVYLVDVSSRRELEERMIQSQKMQAVGQLAGGIAHDFNNLLTAMSGFCDLLLARHRSGDPSFADIMQIRQNANRAANLVRQLLAFSRRQALNARVVDVTETLADLSHLLRRLIGADIDLRMNHGRGLKPILVDQSQLEQVLVNLIVNARDAMDGSGVIQVRTYNVRVDRPLRRRDETVPAGDYVLIEVGDSGAGIPEENLDRVFEPFFSTKEVGAGTGLGLSTVYGIVKQTNGFVFLDSVVGEGATFSIYLPAHDGSVEREVEPGAAMAIGGEVEGDLTGTGTILLVEDEDPVRLFAARALRGKGYTVLEARTGEIAVSMMRDGAERIDLLITDVMMPGMDGPSLIRESREIGLKVPVICISGYSEDALRQRISEDEAVDFLAKPFSLKQLAAKVRDVLNG